MKRTSRILALLMFVVLALAAVGCGNARRPAPRGELAVQPGNSENPPVQTMTVALYFGDWQAQHLIPEQRQVPEADGAKLADQVVKEILAGPTDPHLNRTIPADVKQVEPVTIQDGIAYVNFSKEFQQIRGAAGTTMAVGSLRQSLTEIPGVQKVQILVEGRKDVMMDEGYLLEPMERAFYPDWPVLVDPDRAKYLNERYEQGLDTWRADAAQVVQWEGRMFGFTADELKAAETAVDGDKATATVVRDGQSYQIQLEKNGQIWIITGISA